MFLRVERGVAVTSPLADIPGSRQLGEGFDHCDLLQGVRPRWNEGGVLAGFPHRDRRKLHAVLRSLASAKCNPSSNQEQDNERDYRAFHSGTLLRREAGFKHHVIIAATGQLYVCVYHDSRR